MFFEYRLGTLSIRFNIYRQIYIAFAWIIYIPYNSCKNRIVFPTYVEKLGFFASC